MEIVTVDTFESLARVNRQLDVLRLGAGLKFEEVLTALYSVRDIAKRIEVDEGNQGCMSKDGMVFSKDGRTLFFCPEGSFSDIRIPDGVESLTPRCMEGVKAKKLHVPKSVRQFGAQYISAFLDVEVGTLEIGDGTESIPDFAYRECRIKNLKLPTSLKLIGTDAFHCCGLEAVALPEGITWVQHNAFSGCPIKEVEIPASLMQVGAKAFGTDVRWIQFAGGKTVKNALWLFVNTRGQWLEADWPVTVEVGQEKAAIPACIEPSAEYREFCQAWDSGQGSLGFARDAYRFAKTAELRQDTALLEVTLNPDNAGARKYVNRMAQKMARRYIKAKDAENLCRLLTAGALKKQSLDELVAMVKDGTMRAYILKALDECGRREKPLKL